MFVADFGGYIYFFFFQGQAGNTLEGEGEALLRGVAELSMSRNSWIPFGYDVCISLHLVWSPLRLVTHWVASQNIFSFQDFQFEASILS
ncbi:hypothetical protein BgiMline_002783 [Biomphalaria glabrata]